MSPLDFIPLAEETGLTLPIGLWVMETACVLLKSRENSPHTRELLLAVNVSARQFRQADFVAQVERVLAASGVNPARLKFELTESVVLFTEGAHFTLGRPGGETRLPLLAPHKLPAEKRQ